MMCSEMEAAAAAFINTLGSQISWQFIFERLLTLHVDAVDKNHHFAIPSLSPLLKNMCSKASPISLSHTCRYVCVCVGTL